MSTTQQQHESVETTAATSARDVARIQGPRGIGGGVSFDWAISAQLLIMGSLSLAGYDPNGTFARLPANMRVPAGVATLLVSVGPLVLGEGLRRGRRLAWLAQVALNSVVTVGGLALAPSVLPALRGGHFGDVVRTGVMLIISPIIAWLLLRPQTAAWISRTTDAEALARHDWRWVLMLLPFVIAGGAAIAFQQAY